MFKYLSIAAVGVALVLGVTTQSGPAIAAEPFAKEIKARKAVMQLYSFNLGKLGAMAKGKMAYDAKKAQAAADNLAAVANLQSSAMWPQGFGQCRAGQAHARQAGGLDEISDDRPARQGAEGRHR